MVWISTSAKDHMDAGQLRSGADGAGGPITTTVAMPVSAGASGEGSPYAPEDWPLPGDKWKWRVGLRVTPTGYFQDRYTRPPDRFNYKTGLKGWICGRVSLEKFVREHIPNADLTKFFGSFVWKIPANELKIHKDLNTKDPSCSHSRFANSNGHLEAKVTPKNGECKAGSKTCYALLQSRKGSSSIIICDLCCSEVGFCRDCCCILCCKTVDLACDGYNFIRCRGIINEVSICGHVAHLNCALRAYLAGKVDGDIIDLDAEYYCRRCDNKTDLVTHLTQLISSSKTVHSRADIEKILNMGLCLLHRSGKYEARKLQSLLLSMLKKLGDGVNPEEIWTLGESLHNLTTAAPGPVMEIPNLQQQQLGRGISTKLTSPVPLLINLKGKDPTLLMLHEVPISLQIQDPYAESPQEDVSRHKRSFHNLSLLGPESHKKVRQEQLSLPLVQQQENQTLVAAKEMQELREASEDDSGLREGANLLPEAKLKINHLETDLDQMKTRIVDRLKEVRREVRSRRESKVKEAREGVAKLNNVSRENSQPTQERKTSSGLKKLDRRLNHALGYCQALVQFHRKYPDVEISEFYQSLGRMADLDSVEISL